MDKVLSYFVGFFCFLLFACPQIAHSQELPVVALETGVRPEIFAVGLPEIKAAEGVRIAMDRTETRPGERWLRGQVKLTPSLATGTVLRASLFGVSANAAVGTVEKPAQLLSKVRVNLRGANLERGRLRVEVLRAGQVVSAREVALDSPNTPTVAEGTRIPVTVDVETARLAGSTGISFGVPFAAGALWDTAQLGIVDAKGAPVAAQISPVARWYQDGSVKWARVDTTYTAGSELFVEVPASPRTAAPQTPVIVTEANNNVTVRIGATEYVLGADMSPIRSLSQGGKAVATVEGARGLYLVDQTGRVGTASAKGAKITIESRGPVEATVKIEGPYVAGDGQELARHSTRLQFFAGQPEARISHTFIVTQPTGKIWFREIGWELAAGQKLTGVQAVFNTAADDWRKAAVVPLAPGESASMAQEDHYRFYQGKNVFTLTKTAGAAASAPVASGEEAGDWVSLTGTEGGFLFGTRDAAKRHPKEFLAVESTLAVVLYSPKGGRELDFRSPEIAQTLGLENLIKKVEPRTNVAAAMKKFASIESDATGWAKTHELVLSPVAPGQAAAEYAKPAALMSRPAQALSSPEWLYASRVLGPLHPYDQKNYPEVEGCAERGIAALDKFADDMGEFGFINYEGGPHFVESFSPAHPLLKRWSLSYSVRSHLWYAYARRGQRSVRDFAEGSSRAFNDNYMANWDGANKTRGLFARPAGDDSGGPESHFSLPVPWGESTATEVSGTSDLEMFLLDYYLTGNRRAADAVFEYGEGMKKAWKPGERTWRHLRLLYNVTQAYTLNWDEELGDLARATAHYIADEEAGLGLLTTKPLSTSYKTQSDFLIAPYIASMLDDPRYTAMADKLANYWRDSYIESPIRYGNPDAYVATYLYEKNADPAVAENMEIKLQQLAQIGRNAGKSVPPLGVHAANFWMQGFAYAQHIVKDSGAQDKNIASFMGLEIFGVGPKWYVKKEANQKVVLRFSFDRSREAGREAETIGDKLILRPVGFGNRYGQDLHRVLGIPGGAVVEIPKDAPGGIYEISSTAEGSFAVMADSAVPLMASLAGPWQPLPDLLPTAPIFFQIAPGSTGAKLNLAGRGQLTAPDGTAFQNGEWVSGDIALGDRPGAWKLQLEKESVVRASGFQPLFAVGSASNLFALPDGEENPEAEALFESPTGGIRLTKDETLTITMPETEMKAGTIEFFFRPTHSPGEGEENWRVLTVKNSPMRDVVVNYIASPQGDTPGYQLTSLLPVDNPNNPRNTSAVRGYRRHFFEGGRWNHVAFVWGISKADYKKQPTTTTFITIDGQPGQQYANQITLSTPAVKTGSITFGPGLDGTIAGIRISNAARYTRKFEPPAIGKGTWKDDMTLAAWALTGPVESEARQGVFSLTKK